MKIEVTFPQLQELLAVSSVIRDIAKKQDQILLLLKDDKKLHALATTLNTTTDVLKKAIEENQ